MDVTTQWAGPTLRSPLPLAGAGNASIDTTGRHRFGALRFEIGVPLVVRRAGHALSAVRFVFERQLYPCPVSGDSAVFNLHVEFAYFGDAQVSKVLAGLLDGILCRVLS